MINRLMKKIGEAVNTLVNIKYSFIGCFFLYVKIEVSPLKELTPMQIEVIMLSAIIL